MHDQLDPEIEQPLKEYLAAGGGGSINASNLKVIREQWRVMMEQAQKERPPVDGVDTKEVWVPGPEGDPDVKLKIYSPTASEGALPAVYWMRGGGFRDGIH